MSDLNYTQITVLEVSRFPKDENAKPRIIRYVFVALEFGHSNLEILLRVMQKYVRYGQIEWRDVLRRVFGVWNLCFALCKFGRARNSTSGIARNTRQKRALEFPRSLKERNTR